MQPSFFHGWPTLTRLSNGDLAVVYSGRRQAHVCPFGTVEITKSRDEGESWAYPRTLYDSPIDDRDAGILETVKNTIIVVWFTSLAFEDYFDLEKHKLPPDPAWVAARNRLPSDEARKQELGVWAIRSTDNGITWSERINTIVSSPHGPIQLRDGRLLYVGKALWQDDPRLGVCESLDDGQTWQWVAQIPTRDGDDYAKEYHEPSAVECASGKLVVQIRNHSKDGLKGMLQTESFDGGLTSGRYLG